VHETIDGETMIIHFESGTYYSLDGPGAEIWTLATNGVPPSEIVAHATERYAAEPAFVERSVATLLDKLVDEGLLVPAPQFDLSGAEAVELPEPPAGAFVEPELHKYTDMQEFMLADPIHNVDEYAGWPHAKRT
jgi:hypothetical protein